MSYKFLSKLLANQLRTILPKIISPLQSAFVPQRDIHDNILIAHEILSMFFFLNRTKVGYKTIKLDMKKAYVKLDWNFISKCFQDLGFSYNWINWNMQCTTTISFRVMDSKIDAPFFFPERGQGDPFSLYVFIICTEYLGWLINYLANQKKSGIGIKISKDSISFRV